VTVQSAPPAWWDEAVGDGLVVSGAALGRVGLALPVLAPAQGFLLHLRSIDDGAPGVSRP
jgi:alpha-galactosidase